MVDFTYADEIAETILAQDMGQTSFGDLIGGLAQAIVTRVEQEEGLGEEGRQAVLDEVVDFLVNEAA